MKQRFSLFNPSFKYKLLERHLSKGTKQSFVDRLNQLFLYLMLGFIQVYWQSYELVVHSVYNLVDSSVSGCATVFNRLEEYPGLCTW